MRGLRLGEALADVLVLRDLAVLEEVLVAAGHLEQVLGLELLHHAHLVVLRLKLIRVPDRFVDGVPITNRYSLFMPSWRTIYQTFTEHTLYYTTTYLSTYLMTWRGVSLWLTATVYFCFSQLGDSCQIEMMNFSSLSSFSSSDSGRALVSISGGKAYRAWT